MLYILIRNIWYTAREISSLSVRAGEKIKDKYIWTEKEKIDAKEYLTRYKKILKRREKGTKSKLYTEIFGNDTKDITLRKFKKGFNSTSFTFTTQSNGVTKKWVFKVGHRISPVVGFGDPSSPQYYKDYQRYLRILRRLVRKSKYLTHLLPEPQDVVWIKLRNSKAKLNLVKEQRQTTLIVQPYVYIVDKKALKDIISKDNAKLLLKEFKEFKKLFRVLIENYKVNPDLLGEGNLEIVKTDGEYHLVLLDLGLLNLREELPLTKTVMNVATYQTLNNMENLIKGFG